MEKNHLRMMLIICLANTDDMRTEDLILEMMNEVERIGE